MSNPVDVDDELERKLMTDYNERLDEILLNAVNQTHDKSLNINLSATASHNIRASIVNKAKQALTSLIKELVAEAKPAKAIIADDEMGIDRARKSAANHAINQFEQNLLKAIGIENEKCLGLTPR